MLILISSSILLGIVIGLIFGGKTGGLASPGFKGLWLPVAAFALKTAVSLLAEYAGIDFSPYIAWIMTVYYCLTLLFAALNLRIYRLPSALAAIGSALNYAVIAANGWRMPVKQPDSFLEEFARRMARPINMLFYRVIDDSTRLRLLSDIFFIEIPVIGGYASVGDFLIAAGVFGLVLEAMLGDRFKKPSRGVEKLAR